MTASPEQIHYDIDFLLQALLPNIEYCDWEFGHNEEYGRYMLSPTEHMQIMHSDDCLRFALTLRRPPHDEFVTEVEDLGGSRNFKLKLINTNNLFFGYDTSDYNPLVSCVQYGEAKKRRSNINIQIRIPANELSMALAAAVVETVLVTCG